MVDCESKGDVLRCASLKLRRLWTIHTESSSSREKALLWQIYSCFNLFHGLEYADKSERTRRRHSPHVKKING